MTKFLLNKKEFQLLYKLESSNSDEMLSWKLPNLYYPIVAIFFSLVCYLIFKENSKITTLAFVNLILNGSIPMMALNRLSTLGINIFKFDKGKEKKKSSADTYNLRIKIHYYSQALIISIILLYVFQVINAPFVWSWWFFFQIPLSIVCVYEALRISKFSYLLQERLFDTTFDQEIRDEIDQKGHGENWT